MPQFRYSALSGDGRRIGGEMEGSDRSAVVVRLSGMGHHPIEVVEAAEARRGPGRLGLGRSARGTDITLFARDLAWLLKAGLNLTASLDLMANEAGADRFAATISGVRAGVRKGRALNEALAETGAFPRDLVSMVAIAEASGTLAPALARAAEAREREAKLRARIVSALIYPALLVALATAAVVFILIQVVPNLKDVIVGSGGPVPESAQFVIGLSDGLIAHGFTILLAAPALMLVLALAAGNGAVRRGARGLARRLPVVGTILKDALTVRFCRGLTTLLGAGVSLPESLKLMRAAIGDRELATVVSAMETALRQGGDFLKPLDGSRLFPSILGRMLRVGNETGSLAPSLAHVTELLEEKLDRTIDRGLKLLEPAIILLLSVAVGFIIMSLMGAIVSINDLAV